MTKFIGNVTTRAAYLGKVYQADLGLLINNKGQANFVGLMEGANVFQVTTESKVIPMQPTDDSTFARIMAKLVQSYIKHNAPLCNEYDVSS